MSEKHTRGRLTYAKGISGYSIIAGGETIAYTMGNGSPRGMARERSGENEAIARRLVACWNACEGLSPETLEVAGSGKAPNLNEIFEEHGQLMAQRDELLAALEDARNYIEATTLNASSPKTRQNYGGCLNRIDAAIAKVKGGAA